MSKALEKRLTRLEAAVMPQPLVNIRLIAEDDPDAERLIAEDEQSGLPFPTVIILVAGKRNPEGMVS